MMQTSLGHKLRLLRAERQMSLRQAAAEARLAKETISDIDRGLAHPHDVTLAKLAKAYDVPLEELLEEPALAGTPGNAERPPLGPAPTSQQPSLNGELEEERRARRDAVVQEARQLRKTGRTQMQRALDAWRESKDRGEPYAIRDKHLAE